MEQPQADGGHGLGDDALSLQQKILPVVIIVYLKRNFALSSMYLTSLLSKAKGIATTDYQSNQDNRIRRDERICTHETNFIICLTAPMKLSKETVLSIR